MCTIYCSTVFPLHLTSRVHVDKLTKQCSLIIKTNLQSVEVLWTVERGGVWHCPEEVRESIAWFTKHMSHELLTVSDSLRFPLVTRANPWVSMATAVFCTCSSTYLTETIAIILIFHYTFCLAHQLMNELFPAEWLPSSKIVIFFRGERRSILSSSPSRTRPWHNRNSIEWTEAHPNTLLNNLFRCCYKAHDILSVFAHFST